MKIEKIKIKNFRSYKNEIIIPFKDLNVFLWKNDIGKSTILEALDIFFNDKKACSPISVEDINIDWGSTDVEITVIFSDFWNDIILDTVPTNISNEYILNEEWLLEIKKIYSWATMKWSSFIVANHPNNDEDIKNLLTYKIDDLKKICKDKWISSNDDRKSSELRRVIRESYWEGLTFELQNLPIDKEWWKQIWDALQWRLPTYHLFQSDRSNSDQDNEIQNPMKIALSNILAKWEIRDRLKIIFDEVMDELNKVANWTLGQLKLINPELANILSPKLPPFDKLAWDKPFWKTEITSDEISLNKRWSWVKRMVLLSFFLNEVERRKKEDWLADIIYAFEEPETSQHPAHQQLLIDSFEKLSQTEWVQVILTTHSPYVYKNLTQNKDINLLHIQKNENWEKVIENAFNSFKLFDFSPSWWEINYYVYNLSTYEFFDELYSELEILNDEKYIDDFIVKHNPSIQKSEQWKKANDDGTQEIKNWNPVIWNLTYISCIRHQIHHSNNQLNIDYKWRLDEWIKDMIQIIYKVKNII